MRVSITLLVVLCAIEITGCRTFRKGMEYETEKIASRTIERVISDEITKVMKTELPDMIEAHVGKLVMNIIPYGVGGGGGLLGLFALLKRKNEKNNKLTT